MGLPFDISVPTAFGLNLPHKVAFFCRFIWNEDLTPYMVRRDFAMMSYAKNHLLSRFSPQSVRICQSRPSRHVRKDRHVCMSQTLRA